MKYFWLQFDLDNTLMDFSGASKKALISVFDEYDLELNEEIYQVYKSVNSIVWSDFEKGLIDTLEIRKRRFGDFFQEMRITGIDSFAFNARYLDYIVDHSEAYDGVHPILDSLTQKYTMSIVTNGLKEVQRRRITKLNMDKYFESIIVSDEIDVAKPHADFFDHAYNSIPNPPQHENILVIGDNLHSDIIGGINYGFDTCWISHGRSNETDITPTFTINDISELIGVLG